MFCTFIQVKVLDIILTSLQVKSNTFYFLLVMKVFLLRYRTALDNIIFTVGKYKAGSSRAIMHLLILSSRLN